MEHEQALLRRLVELDCVQEHGQHNAALEGNHLLEHRLEERILRPLAIDGDRVFKVGLVEHVAVQKEPEVLDEGCELFRREESLLR